MPISGAAAITAAPTAAAAPAVSTTPVAPDVHAIVPGVAVSAAAAAATIAAVSRANSVVLLFDFPMATTQSLVGWCPIKVHSAATAVGVVAVAAAGEHGAFGEVYTTGATARFKAVIEVA